MCEPVARNAVPDPSAPPCDPAAARAAQDAADCIRACARVLRTSDRAVLPHAEAVAQRCRALWRASYVEWNRVCGNGLNVPDLLWLALCHLFVASTPRTAVHHALRTDTGCVTRVVLALRNTLQRWDQTAHHAALAAEATALEQQCMRVTVLWGSQPQLAEQHPAALDLHVPQSDLSALGISIDVHEEFDNRAHVGEWKSAADLPKPPTAAAVRKRKHLDETCGDPLEPLELLRLGSRFSFFVRWQRALVTPRADGRLTVHTRVVSPAAETASLRRHVQRLGASYLDATLLQRAQLLAQRGLLSLGALDHMVRFMHLHRDHVGGATAVRFDPLRRVTDLAVAHRLSQCTPAETLDAADLLPDEPKFHLADAAQRLDVLRLLRDCWTLILLDNELCSLCDLDFLLHYVVTLSDTFHRRHLFVNATRELRPRLPVLVRCCAQWCVHCPGEVWCCETLEDALVQWATLVRQRHQGRTEIGRDIALVLHDWLSTPPAAAASAGTA